MWLTGRSMGPLGTNKLENVANWSNSGPLATFASELPSIKRWTRIIIPNKCKLAFDSLSGTPPPVRLFTHVSGTGAKREGEPATRIGLPVGSRGAGSRAKKGPAPSRGEACATRETRAGFQGRDVCPFCCNIQD